MKAAVKSLILLLFALLLPACGSRGSGQQSGPAPESQSPPAPAARFTVLLADLWGMQDKAREMEEWQSRNDMFPFLRRFHELLDETQDLPGVFDDIHADYMLKLLRKHDAPLADRMEKGELGRFVNYHFGLCWDQVYKPEGSALQRCRREYDPVPPVADKEKDCVAYIAEFVRHVVDVRIELEGEATEDKAAEIETLSKEVFGTGLEEWALGFHPEIDLPAKVRALAAVSHPKVAQDFTAMLERRSKTMAEYSQDRAKSRLQELFRAEMDFRRTDPDRNGVTDFWTADVSGLNRLKVRGRPAACIPDDVAGEDGSPLKDDPALCPMPNLADYRVYLLRAVPADSEGKPLGTDTDGSGRAWRNRARFAFCAHPAVYGVGRKNSYIIDQTGVVWMKDTGGKPVDRFPADPGGEQWARVGETGGGDDIRMLSAEEEKAAIDDLVTRLDEGRYDAQEIACELADWGVRASRAVPKLLEVLKTSEKWERAAAAGALARIATSPGGILPVLIGIAKDEKEDVQLRRTCVEAAGEFGPEAAAALEDMKAIAASESFDLRAEALRAMVKLDPADGARDFRTEGWVGLLLKKNLHDLDDECESSLLRIGPPAVPALEKIAGDRIAGEAARKIIRAIRRAAKRRG